MGVAQEPPALFALAGHAVRWRLLSALSDGDLRVGELCHAAGERQSLVSYHLRRLRDAGVVRARRSLADGRDTYYALDLAACRALLDGAAARLHPGLAAPTTGGERAPRARVLFLCTGNSSRSQLAEALLTQQTGGRVQAFSAGSRPKPVHPNTLHVLRERGLPADGLRSKPLDTFAGERFDCVVTVCDRVRELCPEFPGAPRTAHWSLPEPDTPPQFAAVADELATRIAFLLATLRKENHHG